MKKTIAIALLLAAPCAALAEPSAAVTPYTFLGRVMDARHVAFDTNRVARVEAYGESGDLLASTKTFFRADSRRNYALDVPMATASADGYANKGDAIEVTVVDDVGKTWSGVVAGATAGASGGVCEVDIVLGEDANGDGIDDTLYSQLKAQWERSDYWRSGEEFDPNKDYDGDGVSTIMEALTGTDPFNPDKFLRITSFSRQAGSGTRSSEKPLEYMSLSFDAAAGHSYVVEEATDLAAKDWKPREFVLDSGTAVNAVSFPSTSRTTPCTVYLLPSGTSKAFFRVKAQ